MKCPYCIKICNKCGRLLVANTLNFYKKKNLKYNVSGTCKKCTKEKSNLYYKENKDDRLNYASNYRTENKDKIKEYKETHKEEHKEYMKKYNKKYTKEHKEEKIEYDKKYREENKNKIRENQKEYREKNKDKIKEKHNEWRSNNKEHIDNYRKKYYEEHEEHLKEKQSEWYENNKEERKEYCKQWYENNPDKVINSRNKRRSKEENQGNGITKDQWLEMMNFFDWKCAYSGMYLNKNDRTIDHIIPLNNYGEHEVWNLVPMYKNYNSSKNTNNMEDWYIKQDFFDIDRLLKIYEWIEYAFNKWGK